MIFWKNIDFQKKKKKRFNSLGHAKQKVQFFESNQKKVQFFESYSQMFHSISNAEKRFNSVNHVQKKFNFLSHVRKIHSILWVILNSLSHLKKWVQFFESCWKEGFNFYESCWKEGFNSVYHMKKLVQFCESRFFQKSSILWVLKKFLKFDWYFSANQFFESSFSFSRKV